MDKGNGQRLGREKGNNGQWIWTIMNKVNTVMDKDNNGQMLRAKAIMNEANNGQRLGKGNEQK